MKKGFLLALPLLLSSALFADDATAPRQQNMYQTVIMIGIALLFFYFILWRPEQKRRKKMQEQRSSLSKGDRVTAMGIIGTVLQIDDKTVILKMVDGAKIEVLKDAITVVQPGASQTETGKQEAKEG